MWRLDTTRTGFIDLAYLLLESTKNTAIDAKQVRNSKKAPKLNGGLCLIWEQNPKDYRRFPNYILLPNDTKRDFLAWINTYSPDLCPLTGKSHVLEIDSFNMLLQRNKTNDRNKYIGAIIGLVLTESILNKRGRNILKETSIRDCLESLSFSLGSAIMSGATSDEFASVAANWSTIQDYSRRIDISRGKLEISLEPWGFLFDLMNNTFSRNKSYQPWSDDDELLNALNEYSDHGTIASRTFELLLSNNSLPTSLLENLFNGTRESRITALEELHSIASSNSNLNSNTISFVIAYVLNRLEPGTLDYLDLALTLSGNNILLAMWYGLIAGLSPDRTLYNSNQGMGWNIAFELLSSTSNSIWPECDLDYFEFKMYLDTDLVLGFQKSKRYGSYVIGLLDCSNTIVALKADAELPRAAQTSLDLDTTSSDVHDALRDMNYALQKLNVAKSKLEKKLKKK